MTSPPIHYLGPAVGKIPLSTWGQVIEAAKGGLLSENQWCELKKGIAPPGKDANTELARDLAALSLQGGVLIFGVSDKTYEVVGCDISGLEDRISAVAAMTVHPPLSPVVYPPIAHPGDDDRHVLVVEVPVSPLAPHMADGRYWGRSSNGKRELSDADVRAAMAERQRDEATFQTRLLAMPDDDPLAQSIEGHPTGNGHIYLLAEPCAPVYGRGEDFSLQNVVVSFFAGQDHPGTLTSLRNTRGDSLGVAVASSGVGSSIERKWEDHQAYLVCHDEDSSLHFTSGGGTMWRDRGFGHNESIQEVVGHRAVTQSARQFLRLVEEVSLRHWGYLGPWRVGIHVTNLRGKSVLLLGYPFSDKGFPRDSYTAKITTTPASWTGGPDAEASRLLLGFLRAVGVDHLDLDSVVGRS